MHVCMLHAGSTIDEDKIITQPNIACACGVGLDLLAVAVMVLGLVLEYMLKYLLSKNMEHY